VDESADNVRPTPKPSTGLQSLLRRERGCDVALESHPGRVHKSEIDHLISRKKVSPLAVATCAFNNVIISHSVGPDRSQRVQRVRGG
jgi:hypothetical protein